MDVTPFTTVHVLNVDCLAGRGMDREATAELRALLVRLASCRMGQLLLRVAVDRRLTIRFGTADELYTPRGMAGGMYLSNAKVVLLKRESPPDFQLLTLAHELQHFVDDAFGWAGPANTIDNEVRANQTEAQVELQLQIPSQSWGLTEARVVRHPEDIAHTVKAHVLYAGLGRDPMRADGRLHSLLANHEVLPPLLSVGAVRSSDMRVGAVGAVANVGAVSQPTMVATGGVTQAATSALGTRHPTSWDPSEAHEDESNIARFLEHLDAHRLAQGA